MVVFTNMGRTSVALFARVSHAGSSDDFVSDGESGQYTARRTCHTRKQFFACGSSSHCLCHFAQKDHLHGYGSCLMRNVHDLTAFFFHLPHSTPSLLYLLNGKQLCNLQHGVQFWPSCRTERHYLTLRRAPDSKHACTRARDTVLQVPSRLPIRMLSIWDSSNRV